MLTGHRCSTQEETPLEIHVGQLNLSGFSYYEMTRGLKAVGATAQLARFEQQMFPLEEA
jgi:hypothetical protein